MGDDEEVKENDFKLENVIKPDPINYDTGTEMVPQKPTKAEKIDKDPLEK